MFGVSKRTPPHHEAAAVVSAAKAALFGIALVSGVVNVLALTSPLFMMQVYDRVLSSRSVPTLVGLAVLAGGLFLVQAVLETLRARILLRIGEMVDRRLSGRVHEAVVRLPLETRMPGDGLQPLRDLDNLRGFLSSQGPTAFFDLPWMPFYLGLCFAFHVWIGVTALVGAVVLVSLTLLADRLSRRPVEASVTHGMARNARLEAGRRNAEAVRAMGLEKRLAARWQAANRDYLAANRSAGDVAGGLGAVSRALRMILQSAMLAVGALLVIEGSASGGVMIASSVLMGRALAPVDIAIASWKPFLMARQSWRRINELLALVPQAPPRLALPAPRHSIRAEALTIVPPGAGRPSVHGVQFFVPAGSALGIIGPSGSGKSTLARALVGAWTPAGGKVRLDGGSFEQWDREALSRHIGYLPQGVELFDGTIAENISRFDVDPEAGAIVAAAEAAGAAELVLGFDEGYETAMGEAGSALSAGQRQRIGLARALYGDPFLVVMDEPNANLDTDGEAAVVAAIARIRARGGIAVVIAHRPSAIAATDLVLMMESGRMKAFGPRDEILSRVLKDPAATPGQRPQQNPASPLRIVAGPAVALDAGR